MLINVQYHKLALLQLKSRDINTADCCSMRAIIWQLLYIMLLLASALVQIFSSKCLFQELSSVVFNLWWTITCKTPCTPSDFNIKILYLYVSVSPIIDWTEISLIVWRLLYDLLYRQMWFIIIQFLSDYLVTQKLLEINLTLWSFRPLNILLLCSSVCKPYKSLAKCNTADFSCTHNCALSAHRPIIYPMHCSALQIRSLIFLLSIFHSTQCATILTPLQAVDLRKVKCCMCHIAKEVTVIIGLLSLRQSTKIRKSIIVPVVCTLVCSAVKIT